MSENVGMSPKRRISGFLEKHRMSVFFQKYTMTIALVVVTIVFAMWKGKEGLILLPSNVTALIAENAYVFLLAAGMLLCILTGGNIDLSVGAVPFGRICQHRPDTKLLSMLRNAPFM